MNVLSVQLSTSTPPTRKVIDSTPVVPLARTVKLLLPPSLFPSEELEEELLGTLTLDELELDDEGVASPPVEQPGNTKLPLCVPWKPKLTLCPTARLPFHETSVAVTVLLDAEMSAFQEPVTLGLWLKSSVNCQPLMAELPSLVTVTFRT